MARLKPGVTLEQARAEMTGVSAALEREDPSSHQGWRVAVASAAADIWERNASTLTLLSTIAGCVLLLVVASVAGMMLVRSAQRARELAVRAALGARRWRLIQPILLEGVLLGAVGGALGLVVANWLLVVADSFQPNRGLATMPRLEWPVLVFAAGASVLTGMLFGLWPAFRISNIDLSLALKAGPIGAGRRGSPTRVLSGLVVVEVALATALLVAGGLMTRSVRFRRSTRREDRGRQHVSTHAPIQPIPIRRTESCGDVATGRPPAIVRRDRDGGRYRRSADGWEQERRAVHSRERIA
jgi:predicted lysophospholipase L1 biosynthesis ABC-type transport system permease subunit